MAPENIRTGFNYIEELEDIHGNHVRKEVIHGVNPWTGEEFDEIEIMTNEDVDMQEIGKYINELV